MTSKSVVINQTNSINALIQQAQTLDANITGIKTACADIQQLSDTEISIQFVCTDGTQIKTIKQSGVWAGRTLVRLANIWKVQPRVNADGSSYYDFNDIQQACADETAEVMFFERKGTNENGPWDMQDFRRPNAIDRGNVNRAKIEAHTAAVVAADVAYRKEQ